MSGPGRPTGRPTEEVQAAQRRSTRQLLAGRLCFIASGYAVSVILARVLGPALYGSYGVLVSLITRVEMISTAGVPGAIAKLIPQSAGEPERVEGTARALLLTIGFLAFGLCWLAAPWVERTFEIPHGTLLFRVAALDVPATALYVSYTGIFGGHRRFGHLAIAQIVYAVAKVAGVLLLLKIGISLQGVLLANALATVAACLYLLVRFPPTSFRPHADVLRRIAAVAVPLGLYVVGAQLLTNLDLYALKVVWEGGDETIGRYVASLNIARTLTVIPTVQSGVLFASLAWALSENDAAAVRHHIQEATRFALIASAGALVMLGPDAGALMALIFSEAYRPGGGFLVLQLVAFGGYAFLDAFAHCLVVSGRQWLAAGILLGLLPAVWGSNLLLIPRIGPIGAAASLAMGVSVGVVILGVLIHRRFGPPVRGATLLRVAAAAAITAAISALLPASGALLLLKIPALGALFLGLLFWWGEVTSKDLGMKRGRKRPSTPA